MLVEQKHRRAVNPGRASKTSGYPVSGSHFVALGDSVAVDDAKNDESALDTGDRLVEGGNVVSNPGQPGGRESSRGFQRNAPYMASNPEKMSKSPRKGAESIPVVSLVEGQTAKVLPHAPVVR
ncbi:hypothetical protein V6N13_043503 [Hibiscus sabdariffa]